MKLFAYPDIIVRLFKDRNQLDISLEFLACCDNQLTPLFTQFTGLKASKKLSISISSDNYFSYVKGEISKLCFYLYVNHNWNPIVVMWKSISGRVYEISDIDIDCDDISFSFENLDVDLYIKQLFPQTHLPFKLANLSFTLNVIRLNLDAAYLLKLRPGYSNETEFIIERIHEFIGRYNEKSQADKTYNGVVHNSKSKYQCQ